MPFSNTAPARKNWIFAPSQDYAYGGSLTLGQFLEDAYQPASALISGKQIEWDKDTRQDTGFKKDINIELEDHLTANFQAFCKATGVNIGGDMSAGKSSDSTTKWHLRKLDFEGFLPSLTYIKDALKSGDVPSKTQWWKARRRLYVVTGLRIARGSSMERREENSSNLNLGLQADASSQNVPVVGGLEGKRNHTQQQKESVGEISDFIFAYRLNEVRYRVWTSHKPISHGQTESTGDSIDSLEHGQEEQAEEEPEGYTVTGLISDPFEGEDEINNCTLLTD